MRPSAEQCDRLVVDWPAQSLRATTLIDTPGIGSTSKDVSRRTERAFLDPDDDTADRGRRRRLPDAHVHAQDAAFLEAFRDEGVARATAVNTVAVLSWADQDPGRARSTMSSARGIAARHRADPTVRGLCQNVVAVAGLLAQTGRDAAAGRDLHQIRPRGTRRPGDQPLLVDWFRRAGGTPRSCEAAPRCTLGLPGTAVEPLIREVRTDCRPCR